jgi:hypothetical protein
MRAPFRAIATAIATAIVALGCHSVRTADETFLHDPSFHIMVKDGTSIPAAATFEFSNQVFKIDAAGDFDLAAIERRLTGAIGAELAEKGYRRVEAEAELLVSYALAVDSPLSAADLEEAYADDFPVDFPDLAPDQQLHYHQGALIIDIVDRATRTLLWRGAIQAGVDRELTDDQRDRRAREVARVLLRHFPHPVVEGSQ